MVVKEGVRVMAVWDEFLTALDLKVFEAAGFSQKGDLGCRPAVLVVDMVYNFVGERPEPILEFESDLK